MNHSVRYLGCTINESLSPISWLHNKLITQSGILAAQQISLSPISWPHNAFCMLTHYQRKVNAQTKKKFIFISWLYMEWRFNIKLCLLFNLIATLTAAVWALHLDIDNQLLRWPFSSLPHTHIQYLCKLQSSSVTTTYNFDLQFDNCMSVPAVFKLCAVESFCSVSHLQV